jgi:hypothetical protein
MATVTTLETSSECAACGAKIEGEPKAMIHRDGFAVGPEVPLCDGMWTLRNADMS